MKHPLNLELPKGFIPRAGARKSRFDADSREELNTTNPTPAQRQRALALPKDGDGTATTKKEPTQSDEQIRDPSLPRAFNVYEIFQNPIELLQSRNLHVN